jgi:hypothetical protein
MHMTIGHSNPLSGIVLEVEFDEYSRLVADYPAIVARFDNDGLWSSELQPAAIRELDVYLPMSEKSDVGMHTEISTDDWFDVGRPAESRGVNHTLDTSYASTRDVKLDAGNLLVLGALHWGLERIVRAHCSILQR